MEICDILDIPCVSHTAWPIQEMSLSSCCCLMLMLTPHGTIDRQSPLLQEEAIGTPESPLSPARSGISTASRSSSSSALSQGAEAPGNKRKAKNKQKAKKKQAKTVIPSATSNRPARQRKPPNRLGFSRTTQHRGEPGKRAHVFPEDVIRKRPS